MLLVVCAVVLEAYADAVFLNTVNIGCAESCGKEGVFGDVLEVSAAKGTSLDVDTGAEYGCYLECLCLVGDGCADLFKKFCIP